MRNTQNGFSLFEIMVTLAILAFMVGVASYGVREYRRGQAVNSAVELVGAVQRAAADMDQTRPLDVTLLASAMSAEHRGRDLGGGGPRGGGGRGAQLNGFTGGAASLELRSGSGYQVRFSGVSPEVCGEMIARLWSVVDGISAGGSDSVVEVKATAGIGGQAAALSSTVASACSGASDRVVLAWMDAGFPQTLVAVAPPSPPVVVAPPSDQPVITPIGGDETMPVLPPREEAF